MSAPAKAIIGEDAELIDKINVFKAFYGIERIRLQNVGLKEFLGWNVSFNMRTGYDIEKAQELAGKQSAEKTFVFGSGYGNGEKASIGCSYDGCIWSRSTGDIQQLAECCDSIGNKLIGTDIDPNTISKETLIPNSIAMRPAVIPFAVDWNEIIGKQAGFYNAELQLIDPSEKGEQIFALSTPDITVKFKQALFNDGRFDDFRIERLSGPNETYIVRVVRRQFKAW